MANQSPFQGNASAFGPQGSGGNPNPYEAYSASMARNGSMNLMQWAAMTDPRTLAAARFAARTFTQSRPGYENIATQDHFLRHTPEGRMITAGMAGLNGMGLFGGGSVGQLAFGAQQMVGNSGFRMNMTGRPIGQQFYGGGYVTDMISSQMISRMRDSFINPMTGLSEGNARGMNQTDIGGAMQAMASRGMFQGLNIGTLHSINPGDNAKRNDLVKQLRQQNLKGDADSLAGMDISKGGAQFVLNPDTFGKVKKTMESTAAMLSDFRDIFGKDMPVAELINQAEKLTGMHFGTMGTPEAARAKLSDLKTKGQAFGMNVNQMVEMDQTLQYGLTSLMASKYGGKPSDYVGSAAKMTGGIMQAGITGSQDRAEAMRIGRDQNRFVRHFAADDIMALHGQGMVSIMGESGTAVEAAFAAEKFGNFADVKGDIGNLLGEYGSAGTPEKRAAIEQKLKAIMQKKGMKAGALLESVGGNPFELMNQMDPANAQKLIDMAASQDQTRMVGNYKALEVASSWKSRYGNTGVNAELVHGLRSSLNPQSMNELMKIAATGDRDAVLKFMNGKSEFLDPDLKTKVLAGMLGNPDFGNQLKEFNSMAENDATLSNQGSKESTKLSKRMQTEKFFLSKMFGGDSINTEGFMEAAWRGLSGDGNVDDAAVLSYMKAQQPGALSQYAMKADASGLDVNAEQAAALDASLGGSLSKSLGTMDHRDLAKILGTESGMAALQAHLDGSTWGVNEIDGKRSLTIADKDKAEASRTTLTDMNRAMVAARLSGAITDPESEARIRKELEGMASGDMKTRLEQLKQSNVFTSSNGKGIDSLVSGAAMWGKGSAERQAIDAQFAADPNSVMKGLDDSIARHRKEAEDTGKSDSDRAKAKSEMLNAQNLKKELSGESKYLGVLTMQVGNEYQMNLFKDTA